MLITDGVSRNFSKILMQYNSNGTSIPVRIFTYLIGREITMVDELAWMACNSRGKKSLMRERFKYIYTFLITP